MIVWPRQKLAPLDVALKNQPRARQAINEDKDDITTADHMVRCVELTPHCQ